MLSRGFASGSQRFRVPHVLSAGLVLAIAFSFVSRARAEDWPTYMHDNRRSGVTSERLELPLSEEWVFASRHAPEPAWPAPKPVEIEYVREVHKLDFDEAFQVVAAGGALYFGSSADNKVYCLDASTGEARWDFFTGGPVRLAPTVWNDRVLVGSDDGFAYCLRADDGKLQWKFRAAPHDDKLLGNGKMISLWPARTGVLVDAGIAYLGAGLFPAEDVHLYAVEAKDGQLIWKNDAWGQVSSGWRSRSPQGYLLASEKTLFVPCGKALPTAFDRKDGRLLYQRQSGLWWHAAEGGTYALLSGEHLFGLGQEVVAYRQDTGGVGFAWFPGRRLIVTKDLAYLLTDTALFALDRETSAEASWKRGQLNEMAKRGLNEERAELKETRDTLRRQIQPAKKELEGLDEKLQQPEPTEAEALSALRKNREAATKRIESLSAELDAVTQRLAEIEEQLGEQDRLEEAYRNTIVWQNPCECPDSMILAGETLFTGGENRVMAIDATTGEGLWTGEVTGRAKGLAVSGGRLFVSTDKGTIHCFTTAGPSGSRTVRQQTDAEPYPQDKLSDLYRQAAERIVRETGIRRGYALVLGCGTGRLAFELAKRTELTVYGIDEDGNKIERARTALDSAGLYGTRVTVEEGSLSDLPYSDYFADLVVCDDMLVSGGVPGSAEEVFRVLKPRGGTAYLGQPQRTSWKFWKRLKAKNLRRWLSEGGVGDFELTEGDGVWAKLVRPPLPGAGSWTHQYANPGNTVCSDDQLVRCPLGVLWFGRPGPGKMVQRHRAAAGPLAVNGRLFVQGENLVMAYDSYNGLRLWEREIEGAMRTNMRGQCSNLAANEDSLFVAVGDRCLRLHGATGETRKTYSLPPSPDGTPRSWGYVAVVGDTLFGSAAPQGSRSDLVFALDVESGESRWVHRANRIAHNTIAIGDGCVFFAESRVSGRQRQEALKEKIEQLQGLDEPEAAEANKKLESADVRLVAALDSESGRVRWRRPVDLTDCGGSVLAAIYHDGILLFCGSFANGHYWDEFHAGALAHRRATALSGADGSLLWSRALGYRTRPLVNGDTIYADPWAFDLRTGEQVMRTHPVSGEQVPWEFGRGHHCGAVSASPNCLFLRSLTTAYYDLIRDSGVIHFGGHRPGCYMNMIAADGLVLEPEASSGCVCAFSVYATVVFKPRDIDRAWGTFCSHTPAGDEDGFIRNWLVCGPFPNYLADDETDYEDHSKLCWGYAHDFLKEWGGEVEVAPVEGMECEYASGLRWRNEQMQRQYGGKNVRWQKHEAPGHLVDFEQMFPPAEDSVAYAYCEIDSPSDRKAVLTVGSDDGIKIWLNHELVHDNHVGRAIAKDEDLVSVGFKKGRNKLLVKVDQGSGGWGFCLRELPVAPVKHLAINFGAPGDRRDGGGSLWLGYPRSSFPLILTLNFRTTILPGFGYFMLNPEGLRIGGTDTPWVFSSGCLGLSKCVIPLTGAEPGVYTVRLGFVELTDVGRGRRIVDIKLQGEVVAEGFDILKEAGARNRAIVKEFKDIEVKSALTIELVPKAESPTKEQAPVISSLEVIRQ